MPCWERETQRSGRWRSCEARFCFGGGEGPSPSIYRPGARQSSIALIHLGVRVPLLEVDEMIVARDPRRHVVGDLVDLGSEAFMLYESAEGLGVADQTFLGHR